MTQTLQPHTQQLAEFYTSSAHKRHHTRRRPWPEFAYIATYINQLDLDHLTIIELGCGDGRLYTYLVEHCPTITFSYTWVDVSQWLIDLATEHYPNATRICEEMNSYLESRPQQSCDMVIAIASINTSRLVRISHSCSMRCIKYSIMMDHSSWPTGRYPNGLSNVIIYL